ncbi:unnamed protein product [Fraxinus pennsylvanica]|uniref:fructose-bisphosphate aldolase n=1 Tax=Fraxinus pennsylvanica TaxID=56036 RepID=A0AAD2E1R1_9LAMI|nr:unnamed protein product [Fraxinus pennsylvanica]
MVDLLTLTTETLESEETSSGGLFVPGKDKVIFKPRERKSLLETNSQAYRQLLLTTPSLGDYISGAILFEETLYQSTTDGKKFVDYLRDENIVPGITVDKGLVLLPRSNNESWCQGLDELASRSGMQNEGTNLIAVRSPFKSQDPNKPWPIILWLQSRPGPSGVGIGNFEEVGPLDTFLKPRSSTWLRIADLLLDNPVGTGYSFVEQDDKNLLVQTDVKAANDLTTLLIEIFNRNESLQNSPLYVVAQSYGGTYAVTLGLSALKAIQPGKLKLKFGGIDFFQLSTSESATQRKKVRIFLLHVNTKSPKLF